MSEYMPSGKGRLYLLRCESEFESFYKIGITNNSIKRRFNTSTGGSKAMPYIYEVIIDCTIDFDKSIEIESFICSEFESYIPSVRFGGYTECLLENENITTRILELINE